MSKLTLLDYCTSSCRQFDQRLKSATIFAKFLTPNDDSGRHGVLIPSEAYKFFPDLKILDPEENATRLFIACDLFKRQQIEVAYKYYQRYPERRITKLNTAFNDRSRAPIVGIFLKVKHFDGSVGYYIDCINSSDERYDFACEQIFGRDAEKNAGSFVIRDVESQVFSYDESLLELVKLFDGVKEMGWIESLRTGDTGIGYTFEKLIGIEENNRQEADYKGIEVKCKQKQGGGGAGGKINLFQKGPTWEIKMKAKERIRQIGQMSGEGRYACFSQLTTTSNNLELLLNIRADEQRINLQKCESLLGHWTYHSLEKSLAMKHSRAIFVKADVRKNADTTHFRYSELIYCERPTIVNFVGLVENRDLVFEFTMSEKENGTVRNHGYPWRLNREELLKDLFALRIQLR